MLVEGFTPRVLKSSEVKARERAFVSGYTDLCHFRVLPGLCNLTSPHP